ncbi:MAG: FecR domain-containing protein, partial [Myxococcota bacterium]
MRVDLSLAAISLAGLAATGWGIRNEVAPHEAAARDDPPVAVMESVVVAARRRAPSSLVWNSVVAGDPVWQGDGIFVPEGGAAEVAFVDGTRLSLSESTMVIIDAPEAGRDEGPLVVRLRAGSVTGEAGSAGMRLSVEGSTADLPAGTAATVGRGAGGKTRVTVHKGGVTVRGARGGTVNVGADQRVRLDKGKVAEAEAFDVRLDAPATSARIYFIGDTATIRFSWQAEPGRRVLEIAADRGFHHLVKEQAVKGTEADVDGLAPDAYFWRLVANDGRASEERSFVLVRDIPPEPIRPARGQVLYLPGGQSTTFTWRAVIGVRRYRVEISATRTFEEVAFTTEVDETKMRVGGDLPEGIYHWRVRSLARERGESPFSPSSPFRLVVEPLPRA